MDIALSGTASSLTKPIIFIVLTLIYVAQAKILISLRLATPMGFEPTTFNVTD